MELDVINDHFIAADAGYCSLLIPADISVACDTSRGFLPEMPLKIGWCHNRWYHMFQIISMLDNFLPLEGGPCPIQCISFAVTSFHIMHFLLCVTSGECLKRKLIKCVRSFGWIYPRSPEWMLRNSRNALWCSSCLLTMFPLIFILDIVLNFEGELSFRRLSRQWKDIFPPPSDPGGSKLKQLMSNVTETGQNH